MLEKIDPNDQRIQTYQLTEENLQYTKHPCEAVKTAIENQYQTCFGLFEGEVLVSFFVLHENDGPLEYTSNPHAILLRSFSTDTRFTRRGYAKAALTEMERYVKVLDPIINEIVLSVNVQNFAAQQLYEAFGFVDTEKRVDGRNGPLMVMSKNLANN